MKFFWVFIFFFSFAQLSQAGVKVGSLSLASDEIVYELLKRANRLQDFVAISNLSTDERYSHIAQEALMIKHRVGASPEELWMIDADVWIGASYNRKVLLDVIRKKQQPLVMLEEFSRLEDIRQHILKVGKSVGESQHARDLVRELDHKLSFKPSLKKPLKMILWSENGVVAGKKTLWDDLVYHLGGENVVQHTGWKKMSMEALALLNPDVVVTTSSPELIVKSSGWGFLPAVQKNNLIQVRGRSLSSVSHHIMEAFDELKTAIKRFH